MYSLKKYFGIYKAVFLKSILRLDKHDLMFIILFTIVVFVRLHDGFVNNSLTGEVADNLLDIKNYWERKELPLKGPPTSHPWLYFGPLYYWLYGPILVFSGFNPKSHFIFGAVVSILTVLANYVFIKKVTNARIALLSSFIIAFSPFFIIWGNSGRFFTIVLLLIYPYLYLINRYIRDSKYSLFIPGILMGVILNFHFTPLLLVVPTLFLAFKYKRNIFVLDSLKFFTGILFTNIPLLLYDAANGFSMIMKFILWIPYRLVGFLGLYPRNTVNTFVLQGNFRSFYEYSIGSFVVENKFLSLIFFVVFVYAIYKIIILVINQKEKANIWLISLSFLMFAYLGIFIHGLPPEHYYMPIAFVPSLLVAKLVTEMEGKLRFIVVILIIISSVINLYNHTYIVSNKGSDYDYKTAVAEAIIVDVEDTPYAISRIGDNDQFAGDFAQDYQYLLWQRGNEPVRVGDQKISNEVPVVHYIIVERDINHPAEIMFVTKGIKVYKKYL